MWYRVQVKYKVLNARGKYKPRSEEYLMNGISYGDVEHELVKITENRVTGYKHRIREANFQDIYEPHVSGDFYAVTIEEEIIGKRGETKTRNYKHLVVANSVSNAQDRAADYMKNWVIDTKVIGADVTKIVGVWHPHHTQWQDDFKSRAADGFATGKATANADPNQLSAFEPDGTAKADDAPEPDHPTATKSKKRSKISFFRKDGELVDGDHLIPVP